LILILKKILFLSICASLIRKQNHTWKRDAVEDVERHISCTWLSSVEAGVAMEDVELVEATGQVMITIHVQHVMKIIVQIAFTR
jgi:hypothetical protein